MSGLLNKATAVKESEAAAAAAPKKLNPATTDRAGSEQPSPMLPRIGWAAIVIAGILSLQGGAIGLVIVCFVALAGVGLLVQHERMQPELNTVKVSISVVLAVLISLGPYAALVLIPQDSSMALTQIEMDQESDEVTFYVRGSFSSSTASISSGGEELWTGSEDMSNDFAKYRVPVSSFFQGNAQDNTGATIKSYEISIESDDGQTETREIPPTFMNREVLESGAKITMITKTETSSSSTDTEVDGLLVESIVGLFGPSEEAEDGGDHSMSTVSNYLPVFSDYTIQIKVMKGSSQKWQSPIISVDGTEATWVSAVSGSKFGSTDRWMGISGTGYDADTGMIEILKKEDFYDNAGCYTFQVVVTNEYYTGETSTQSSSSAWELDFSNEDGEMSAC
ncbi:MAG: hypothetical protein QNL85_03880 [Euryarchaeota archaeon]